MAYIVRIKFGDSNRFPKHIESIDLTVGTRGDERFRVVRSYNSSAGTYDTIFDVVELARSGDGYDVSESGDEGCKRRSHPTSVHETLGITRSYINASQHIEIDGVVYKDSSEALSVLENNISGGGVVTGIRGASSDDLVACYPV